MSTRRFVFGLLAFAVVTDSIEAQQQPVRPAPVRPVARPARPVRPVPFAKRAVVSLDGGFQASSEFVDAGALRSNAESGAVQAQYPSKSGPVLNVSAAFRIGPRWGVGAGFTQMSRSSSIVVSGRAPHPFFFNTPRTFEGAVPASRQETAVHFQVRGVMPVGRNIQIMAFGGPSVVHLSQDVATGVVLAESYPFDTVQFRSAAIERGSGSTLGFNVGGDVAYYFTPRVGVGGGALFSAATVHVPTFGGATTGLKAGGTSLGGGLRLKF